MRACWFNRHTRVCIISQSLKILFKNCRKCFTCDVNFHSLNSLLHQTIKRGNQLFIKWLQQCTCTTLGTSKNKKKNTVLTAFILILYIRLKIVFKLEYKLHIVLPLIPSNRRFSKKDRTEDRSEETYLMQFDTYYKQVLHYVQNC